MNKSINIKLALVTLIFLLSFSFAAGQASKVITSSSCRLFADKGNMSSVIEYLSKDTELELLALEDDYVRVKLEDAEGFILKEKVNFLNANGELVNIENNVGNEGQEEVTQSTPHARFNYLVSVYGQKAGLALFEHKVWKGISRQMAQDSWGEPSKVNRAVVNDVIQEEWVYSRSWLFFEDDVLTRWGRVRK